AWVGFPALLAAAGALLRRRVRKGPGTPRLSLIIAAYNEEDAIVARLENALPADYPAERLEVQVASDGSTDGTVEKVRAFAHRGVELLELPRGGKIRGLDAAARRATGEVLVFSDANTHVEPAALRAMAANFADPEVGGVVARTGYREDGEGDSAGLGESL